MSIERQREQDDADFVSYVCVREQVRQLITDEVHRTLVDAEIEWLVRQACVKAPAKQKTIFRGRPGQDGYGFTFADYDALMAYLRGNLPEILKWLEDKDKGGIIRKQ